jgi:cytoskeletal protein RodZ
MSSLLQGQDISFDIGFGNIPLVVYGALGITSFIIAATTVMQISKSSEGSPPETEPATSPESSPAPEPAPEPASESSEEKTEGGKSKNRKSKSKKNKQNKSKSKKL